MKKEHLFCVVYGAYTSEIYLRQCQDLFSARMCRCYQHFQFAHLELYDL